LVRLRMTQSERIPSGRFGIGRLTLHRLAVALLAIMVQIAIGARVPDVDAAAVLGPAQSTCHAADERSDGNAPTPMNPADCLSCPICLSVHVAPLLPVSIAQAPTPPVAGIRIPASRRPATAPPSVAYRTSQPRAPPLA
jgi:hypothetical protein